MTTDRISTKQEMPEGLRKVILRELIDAEQGNDIPFRERVKAREKAMAEITAEYAKGAGS